MDGNAGRVGEVFAGAVSGQGFSRRHDQMCCDGCLLWLPGVKNTNEQLVLQTLHLNDQTPLILILKQRRRFTKDDEDRQNGIGNATLNGHHANRLELWSRGSWLLIQA